MERIIKNAYAKINLTLEILDIRQDGYHNIRSIMQKVSLCDVLTFDFNDSGVITLECSKNVCEMKDNLAYKAAEKYLSLYIEKCGKSFGVSVYIEKNIPDKAGLAGGSADCACVLDCLYEVLGVLDYEEIESIAASLGSDINFCLNKYRCALCTDRGIVLEKCRPLRCDRILICVPDFGMKTSDIYRAFDSSPVLFDSDPSAIVKKALEEENVESIYPNMVNSFEKICESECRDIADIRSTMLSFGAKACRMSGSGSSVFGIFDDDIGFLDCKATLEKKYTKCFACSALIE